MTARAHGLRVDVTGGDGLEGRHETAATLWLPERIDGPLTVMVAYPGGGYSRAYYDIGMLAGYSQAEYHTDRGYVFVACDHLGVGDSTPCDMSSLSFEQLAAANHATVTTVLERLRAGTLADDVPPVDVDRVIGMGQSMGGCLLIVQQARHRSFDGIAILGSSAIHANFPGRDGSRITHPAPPRGADLRPLADLLVGQVAHDAALLRYWFHAPDEDARLVEADSGTAAGGRASGGTHPPWRSATMPACAFTMTTPGVVAEEAAMIDVPVLVACGEVDVVPDPWTEPSAYRGSHDVAVFVVRGMHHMHNFARTRELLWDRVAAFARGVRPRTLAVPDV